MRAQDQWSTVGGGDILTKMGYMEKEEVHVVYICHTILDTAIETEWELGGVAGDPYHRRIVTLAAGVAHRDDSD